MSASAVTKPALEMDQVIRLRTAVMRLSRRLRQQGGGGITPSQLAILGSLERGGPQTLGQLAAAEGVQPPSITRVVRALEEQRLVTRTTLAEDRRSAQVELTAKARRLIENIRRQRTAWLAQRVEALAPGELADLERGIGAMELLLEVRA